MVKGLDLFKKHFADYTDKYVLIGGTACTLVMEEFGLDFRATKDLDIVLHIEVLDSDFVSSFWKFIEEGEYQHRQQSNSKEIFYRFRKPNNTDFPAMLELFSRLPDVLHVIENSHLTPIPTDESVTSLSAILLDNAYYQFIHSDKQNIDGLPVVSASHLIPLKARAWIDLMNRKNVDESINERDIRKHKNDIMRLYQLLAPSEKIILPQSIKKDMKEFLDRLKLESPIDLKSLGIKSIKFYDLLSTLQEIYDL